MQRIATVATLVALLGWVGCSGTPQAAEQTPQPSGISSTDTSSSESMASGNAAEKAEKPSAMPSGKSAVPARYPGIPSRPEDIEFAELAFEPPAAKEYHHTLDNGVSVYLMRSTEFPLVDFTFTFKGGSYLEPAGKEGLAMATGSMIRRGGSSQMRAEEMDERFDFLAAECSTGAGDEQCSASLNTLKSNLDESFDLFMDMLRNPRFQEDRFALFKAEMTEGMKQRNDDAGSIRGREWDYLFYGEGHYQADPPTAGSMDGLTVEDLRSFHREVFQPKNLIIGVTGDFEIREMLALLNDAMQGWSAGSKAADPPAPVASIEPGVYHVEKDIPQGKVFLGARTIRRDHPDRIPMMVMNEILGGGGFTSRITNKVRTEHGLSYSAGSMFRPGVHYDGEFRAYFDSKNNTVAFGIQLILDEIARIREEPVSAEELATAKNSFIESFPQQFQSKSSVLGMFIRDEMTGRDPSFWTTFRDKVRGVSVDDVKRVASEYLHPDNLTVLVVGKWDEIGPGNYEEGRPEETSRMADFFDGKVTHLPLRDPLTLEPIDPGS